MSSTRSQIRPRPLPNDFAASAATPTALVSLAPSEDAEPVGAGLIIGTPDGERSILTCAHVVVAALGQTMSRLPPPGAVYVRTWAHPSIGFEAVVRADGWFPVDEKGRGDVAVLASTDEGAYELPLARLSEWSGRSDSRWQTFGYPTGYKRVGQHASGRFLGRFGPGNEWVQLDAEGVTGYRIVQGYSGSPVWDLLQNAVVGLAVSEDAANPHARSGGMIPIEVAARYWTPLENCVAPSVRNQSVVVDQSWLRTDSTSTPHPPSSVGFTVTNVGEAVAKLTSIACHVVERADHEYEWFVLGIPHRYELELRIDEDHDHYELLDRQHIVNPLETEEYELLISADRSGTRYTLSLEFTWRTVDRREEGRSYIAPFQVYH